MKPQHIKSLFPKKQPRIVFQNLFLALPTSVKSPFQLPSWQEIFGNTAPVSIEFCSGNGHWIVEMAKAHPHENWVAVEWQFERARRILSKRENEQLTNLFIVCGEALRFTKEHVANQSVAKVFVHFPDPWPKRRHAKHRLMTPLFLQQLARIVQMQGELCLVTDDKPYMQEAVQHLIASKPWQACYIDPFYEEVSDYGSSTFAQLWKSLGRRFLITRFTKQEPRPIILPIGGNVRSVVLDCSAQSTLRWEVSPGIETLWELQTDLFDHQQPQEWEIRSFELAIDHLIDTILDHHKTFGVLLYKGKPPLPLPLLRSLAARLPDHIKPYLAIDLSGYEESDFFNILAREHLQHFGLILKGGSKWPYAQEAIGWNQPSAYGVYESVQPLLPAKSIALALCYSPGSTFTMPKEECRVIPEDLLIDELEGIDHLIAIHPTKAGKRKIAGFEATGGYVTELPNDSTLPQLQETSQLAYQDALL